MRRGGQLLPARRKRQSFKSSRMPSMTDMPETFETFLRIWIAENISSLGDHTDPSDWKFIVRRKSDELTEAATISGFYGELVEAAQPYGGVVGYVRYKFEEASRHI
jgi:hypothetical protein